MTSRQDELEANEGDSNKGLDVAPLRRTCYRTDQKPSYIPNQLEVLEERTVDSGCKFLYGRPLAFVLLSERGAT
jgi:hypothetical protein